jgi:hypothetical protein
VGEGVAVKPFFNPLEVVDGHTLLSIVLRTCR